MTQHLLQYFLFFPRIFPVDIHCAVKAGSSMADWFGLKKDTPKPDLGFEFSIARSARRRSISIEIRQAQVVIRAPIGVAQSVLIDFLQQKAAWVREKIREQQQTLSTLPEPRSYMQGSEIPFMDETLTLVIGRGPRAAIARIDQQLHVILSARARMADETQIRQLLSRWYQQQALNILTRKTTELTRSMGLVCTQVSIKATRSKWGHCTSRGAIQYNWQILLAPEAIVDYLVAHEVSHLRHQNHSADFWSLVASICPTFKADRAWLKAEGAHLCL
ncbi:MAG: SprT family zinc-dependent metalloprotease [Cellvibrio sp.]|uniref:M48 family metallopeptidase n=1 Tax=Cellvibrio sp. TaxID=1965322 RepID=UPI00319EBEA0